MSDDDLRSLPISDRDSAEAYLRAFDRWIEGNNPYGMGAMLPATHKPCCVRSPDLFRKAREAKEVAGLNYWQMPYEQAVLRFEFRGLPRSKWEQSRKQRGLPLPV